MKKFLAVLLTGILMASCQSKEDGTTQKQKEINVYTALEK